MNLASLEKFKAFVEEYFSRLLKLNLFLHIRFFNKIIKMARLSCQFFYFIVQYSIELERGLKQEGKAYI